MTGVEGLEDCEELCPGLLVEMRPVPLGRVTGGRSSSLSPVRSMMACAASRRTKLGGIVALAHAPKVALQVTSPSRQGISDYCLAAGLVGVGGPMSSARVVEN